MYKISSITHKDTGRIREDGRYPNRIGCIFNFYLPLKIGSCALLEYIKDNQGNDKSGILRTSIVEKIFEDEKEIVFSTTNSTYTIEKIKDTFSIF